MWKQLQELLTSPKSSPNIIKQTLWVIGTAIQNSPEAQNAASVCVQYPRVIYLIDILQCLKITPIPTILLYLGANNATKIRSKAMYALSALLKHNKVAVNVFGASGGWDVLRTAFGGGSIQLYFQSFLILLHRPINNNPPQSVIFY